MSPASHKATTLNVVVPAGAVVYLDDYRTRSTGKKRRYVWHRLQPDQTVPCRIRAEMMVNGKKVQETKQLNLRGGVESSLTFDFEKIETKLTVLVPAAARVYLGKSFKSGSGPVRTFTSTKLASGQGITDYPVRVSVFRNGQEITKVQRISLDSGQSKTLAFHFDRETSASIVR